MTTILHYMDVLKEHLNNYKKKYLDFHLPAECKFYFLNSFDYVTRIWHVKEKFSIVV